ncbi:MAG: ABC transporter permease [Chthonomonadales bacterium]
MMRGYLSIFRKEILHLVRDPTYLVIALVIPMVQLTLFGFAIDFDVRHIATAVVDLDRSPESRRYIASLRNTQYLDPVMEPAATGEAEAALRSGAVRVVVVVPPGFERQVLGRTIPQVRVLIDGSDSQVAIRAQMALLGGQRARFSPHRIKDAGSGPGIKRIDTQPWPVDARVNVVFNPAMRTQIFMIPGLIGVIMQLVTIALTAFSIVRERELGTLEQLMVSPVGRLGLILGKVSPYALLAFFEMGTVLYVGWTVFDVRIVGDVWLLLGLSIPFIVASLSLGLLISTVARNQAQALQFTLLITLPSILMSGFVFPRETMPGAIYLLSHFIPVTFFLNILRGVIVRGAGFGDLEASFGALVVLSILLLAAAGSRFRKTLA